ncbi:MAG: hypothetical protein K2I04_06465, partial [Muribaculaceae bacterium]|nr:hypothetical protein [Muribaculaceae bacterium]
PKVASEKIPAPVKRGSQPLHFKLPKSGHYAAVVTVNGKIEDSRAARFIVTPLKGFALSCSADVYAGVVDFTTGAPLEGVTVSGNDRQSGKLRTSVLGKSDNDGLVRFDAPRGDRYSRRWLSFKKDGKTYDFDGNVYYYNYNKPDTASIQRSTLIFTDRAIYHPGDSINWAVVTASSRRDGKDRHTSADTEITVRLLDANYQEVAKSMMRTDALGRAYGSFATKKEGLTGNYTIRVEITGQRGFASSSVMVSDFKAPVFEVSVTSVKRDMPAKGEITVEGIAKTYSGMPVAGAKVALTLKGASRWRWFSPQATLGTLDATTASDGTFSVKLPADMLGRPLDNGIPYTDFIAEVTVTSATAETAETTRAFTTGKPYTLTATCGQTADSDKPFTLNVAAYDADGNEAAVAFRWRLTDREKVPAQPSGEGVTGTPLTINVADVVSGRYFFEITPVDSSLASEIKTNEFDLYSISRNTVPRYADALFVPVTKAKADASGKVSVLVGANAPELTVFGVVRHGDNMLRPTVNTMLKGFTTLEYKLPEGADAAECQLLLVATRDGKTITVAIELESAPVAKTEIVAETFRDRLTPGAGERWRLRLVKGSKGLADAGFIATMYDHALDALTTQSWPSGFGWLSDFSSIVMSTSRLGTSYGNTSLQAKMSDEVILEWPSFLFGDITSRAYSRLYSATNGIKIRGSNVLLKAEATMDSSAAIVEEDFDVEDSEADAGAGSADDNTAKETYRDPEVLQALWQPSLVADADGNVDIVFTVPNANTTWQFKALGWTKETDMASFARTALANKPIMVKPNLPRFLRQGDTATVLATVFNNTDETASVETEVAMFDIRT